MKWKKRQEIYIGYSSERIPYGNAKNWESLYKACRKKTNRTWEQQHNLKGTPLNTSNCIVRVESSMTCGQILASYVRVKKKKKIIPFTASPSTASALYFSQQHLNIPSSWIGYWRTCRSTSSYKIHSNKLFLCFHWSCSKTTCCFAIPCSRWSETPPGSL